MMVVDSSVVIAGFASWHENHSAAVKALAVEPRLVGHAALESYSVLTRLPPPHRAQPGIVHEFLRTRFRQPYLSLSPVETEELLHLLAERQILGGQVYDALIGFTVAVHGGVLVSLDRRATLIYEAVGVPVQHPA